MITVRVSGLDGLVRALHRARTSLLDLPMAGIARQGQALAAGFAPRRTGRLASTVRARAMRNRATVSAGSAAVPYAGPINYGWRRRGIAPSGFMQRADRVLRTTAPQQLDQLVQRVVARASL